MPRIQGSDSSKWDTLIDWTLAKTEVFFNISKATEGTSVTDSQYINNKTNCFANGVPFGAYHFYRFGIDPVLQARHFVAVAGTNLDVYACDVETVLLTQFQEQIHKDNLFSKSMEGLEKGYRGLETYTSELKEFMDSKLLETPFTIVNEFGINEVASLWDSVQIFLNTVESLTGNIPWLYSSPAFLTGYLKPPLSAKRYPLWIAHYFVIDPTIVFPWNTLPVEAQYVAHQDTYKAQFPGFPPDCDSDKSNPYLDMDDILRIFGNGTYPNPIVFPFYVRVNTTAGLNIRIDPTNNGQVIAVSPYNTLLKVEGIEHDENGRERYKVSAYVAGWLTRKV